MPVEENNKNGEIEKLKKIGKRLIKIPLLVFIISLVMWSIMTTPMPDSPEHAYQFGEVLGTILYILIFLSFFSSIVCVPLGIYFLRKAKSIKNE